MLKSIKLPIPGNKSKFLIVIHNSKKIISYLKFSVHLINQLRILHSISIIHRLLFHHFILFIFVFYFFICFIINLYKLREEPSPRDNVRLYTGYSHNPQPMNKHSLKGPSINPHSLKQIQTPHSYPQTNFIQNTNILPKKFKFTQPHNFLTTMKLTDIS